MVELGGISVLRGAKSMEREGDSVDSICSDEPPFDFSISREEGKSLEEGGGREAYGDLC
jgi:hypothetical protein